MWGVKRGCWLWEAATLLLIHAEDKLVMLMVIKYLFRYYSC